MLLSESPLLLPIPQGWEKDLADFELYLRARGLSAASVDTRIRHLRHLARAIHRDAPEDVTSDDLVAWSGSAHWAPETRHANHMSARAFFRWRQEHRGAGGDPSTILAGVRRPATLPRPTPEQVVDTAIQAAAPRTQFILRLAAEMGLRRGEIARLHHRDFDRSDTPVVLTVTGKGGSQRRLPVPPHLASMVAKAGKQTGQGWVFPSPNDSHLSERWVGKLAAKALPSPWALHTLRHRFATIAYTGGGHDIISVQRALGHTSIQTTQRYAASTPEALTAAAHAAALPIGPRATTLATAVNAARLPKEHTMTTIAICNAKGGTGKTTTAIMLAAYLADQGFTTRVLDADPQGSATDWANRAEDAGDPLPFGVDVVNAASIAKRRGTVDYEFIDCPPGSEKIIDTAVRHSDAVIVPVSPSGIEVARMWDILDFLGDTPAAVLMTSVRLGTRTYAELTDAIDADGTARFDNSIMERQDIKRLWGYLPRGPWHGYAEVADELPQLIELPTSTD